MTKTKNKKYQLTNEIIKIDGRILHRIRAIRDVVDSSGQGIVEAGDYGGYVQSERNLSHEGGCWISGDAACYGSGRVLDDAIACDEAQIHGCAMLYDKAIACDRADLSGNARVLGEIRVCDEAHISGKAFLQGSYTVDSNIPYPIGWDDE